jgi:hypothetical protein
MNHQEAAAERVRIKRRRREIVGHVGRIRESLETAINMGNQSAIRSCDEELCSLYREYYDLTRELEER